MLWLDGADPDGDMVNGGDLVAGTDWIDKSTAANASARQTAAFRLPTVEPGVLNGLSVLRFDGNDFMDVNPAAFGMLSNVSGATMFLVANTPQLSGPQRVFMVSTGPIAAFARAALMFFETFSTPIAGSGNVSVAGRRLDGNPFQRISGDTISANQFQVYAGSIDYANATSALYVDGNPEAISTNFQTPGNTSPSASANIRVGADAGGAFGIYEGDIAEIVVYNRALPEAERQTVEAYLQDKWLGPQPGGATTYAVGAASANRLDLASSGSTSLGGTFEAVTTGVLGAGTPVITLVSLANENEPLLGGLLLVNLAQSFLTLQQTAIAGSTTNALPIPNAAALAGLSVFFQSASPNAAQPGGWDLSNGLELVVSP